MNISRKQLGRATITGMVFLLILFAILNRIQNSSQQLSGSGGIIFGFWPVVSLLLFVIAVIISSLLWGGLLGVITKKEFKKKEIITVNIASWLLKYIPGQVGAFVWKVQWGSKKGLSKTAVTTSFIYENLLLGISSTLYTVPIILLLLSSNQDTTQYILLGVLIACIFILVSIQGVLRKILHTLIKLTRRKVDIQKVVLLSFKDFILFQALYILPRIVNAIGFIFIASQFSDLTVANMIFVGAVYTLAGIIGILAIFVPSGIGVREGIIVLFLSQIMSPEIALVIALNARIYATIADGALALIYVILSMRRKQ